MVLSFSSSISNLIFGSVLFSSSKISLALLSVSRIKMSSTYFMMSRGRSMEVKTLSKRSSITKSARMGLSDEPILRPLICLYSFPLNVISVLVMQTKRMMSMMSFISSLLSPSFSCLFKTDFIAVGTVIFVNIDITSYE